MLKISVISYRSTILHVHWSVFFVFLRFPDQYISISNATLTRPTTRDTRQSFIRGVTAIGMNPLPIYIPFLTEKVSSFVHFPLKMVSCKKSLLFASRFECTVPLFFLFLNFMNRKKKDIFSAFCFLILPYGSFSQPFIYTFDIKIHYPPTYLKP